jgi:hypothetical protein
MVAPIPFHELGNLANPLIGPPGSATLGADALAAAAPAPVTFGALEKIFPANLRPAANTPPNIASLLTSSTAWCMAASLSTT